jgi:hypothetical protein
MDTSLPLTHYPVVIEWKAADLNALAGYSTNYLYHIAKQGDFIAFLQENILLRVQY